MTKRRAPMSSCDRQPSPPPPSLDAASRPPLAAVRAEPSGVSRQMSAKTAFQVIARGCLRQMRGNARPLVERRDGEAVHQMRVAVRRLRAAQSTFRPVLGDAIARAPREDLRWLMGVLGPARDADVFVAEILGPVCDDVGGEPGLAALHARCAAVREARLDAAVAAVADGRFDRLSADLRTWLEDDISPGGDDDPAVAVFARQRLKTRWRKVARPARCFDRLTDGQRHDLRIQVKKLRYALDALAPVLDGRGSAPLRRRLGRLQDQLGALNDVAVARQILRDLATEPGLKPQPGPPLDLVWAAGLVGGWHRRAALDQRAAAAKTLRDVLDGPRPWRAPGKAGKAGKTVKGR